MKSPLRFYLFQWAVSTVIVWAVGCGGTSSDIPTEANRGDDNSQASNDDYRVESIPSQPDSNPSDTSSAARGKPASLEESERCLKAIATAMLSFHDANGNYPLAGDKSWRSQILAQVPPELVGEWEGTNKTPHVFGPGSEGQTGLSRYLVFTGPGSLFPERGKTSIRNIRDGSSRTLLAIEVGPAKAQPWQVSKGIPLGSKNLLAELGEPRPEGYLAVMCDGQVVRLKKDIDQDTLHALATPGGLEPPPSDFEATTAADNPPKGNFPLDAREPEPVAEHSVEHGDESHGSHGTHGEQVDSDVQSFTIQLFATEEGTLKRGQIEGDDLGGPADFRGTLNRLLSEHIQLGVRPPKTGAIIKMDPQLQFQFLAAAASVSSQYINSQTPTDAAGLSGRRDLLQQPDKEVLNSILLVYGELAEQRCLIPVFPAGTGPSFVEQPDQEVPPVKIEVRSGLNTAMVLFNQVSLGGLPEAVGRLSNELSRVSRSLQDDQRLEIHLDIGDTVAVQDFAPIIRACNNASEHKPALIMLRGLEEAEVEEIKSVELGVDPKDLADLESARPFTRPDMRILDASKSRLRKIGLAMHRFEQAHGHFPAAASRSQDGKALLSWRVHLLPFLDELPLYEKFHLNEPWDSEHNRKLIAEIPEVYQQLTIEKSEAGKTCVVVFTGDDAPFGGSKAEQWGRALSLRSYSEDETKTETEAEADEAGFEVGRPRTPPANDGPAVFQMTDGLSNTILCVEASPEKSVPWTQPADLVFDPDDPIAALGKLPYDKFPAVFFDGSTRSIPSDLPTKQLKALITPSGGETVSRD